MLSDERKKHVPATREWPAPKMVGEPFPVRVVRSGRNPCNVSHAVFRCACGNEFTTVVSSVKTGHTRSCGCLCGRIVADATRTHGKSRTPTYRVYLQMIRRCENKKNKSYADYGGRGIAVCQRWRESYELFLGDMGERPSPSHSIDRIDNNGNYEPGNCRWATITQQRRNRRTTKWLTIYGKRMAAVEWAEVSMTNPKTVYARLANGWTDKEAVFGRPINVMR